MHCFQNNSKLKTITALISTIFIHAEKIIHLRKINDKIAEPSYSE